MQLSEQAAERLVREMNETMNSLLNEVGLLLSYTPMDDAGNKVGKVRSLASIETKGRKHIDEPKYRADGLIAGSPEAVERMAQLASRAEIYGEEVCLFSGQDSEDVSEDALELAKGNLSLFKGV